MKTKIPLNNFQQWMQSVIEHPGTDEEAWNSRRATDSLSFDDAHANVLPSSTLKPMERIAIYRRMFYLRMVDAMETDYPGVLHALGEEEFRRTIAEEYVQKFPSSSYTLNHLGREFPRFLEESDLPHKDILAELARLELAISEILDEAESPLLLDDALARIPVDAWERARLVPVEALRLLTFRYPVHEYLDNVSEEKAPDLPFDSRESRVVLYRRDYVVFQKELAEEEFVLLNAIVEGKSLGDAITALLDRFPQREEEFQAHLLGWFSTWVSEGLFRKIDIKQHSMKERS